MVPLRIIPERLVEILDGLTYSSPMAISANELVYDISGLWIWICVHVYFR